ncbi:hypothetical protein TPHA_0K00230 [Tetrapisispora phaffii CBS 4417]|uniref:Large ribosomal subunit protein mL40 n=1 Tax=Tetrapisispora phaffii (strain ATCC 24235 / CBS 4417 / NBRC 1672 / NRRL Y-8282 / UCD 70-5) TaxID=1071381 RepID=G8BZ29_TETPH|nr:mitochondrial 54S ribosomal protein YmL28 TPHA_0K00230 [Tetrapisispora phaffii CBS 4417]CCE65157.1 hypothetical protein TPHA_0K00230 [Tetrapisispora phaffii CBS 4417]
MTVSIQVTRKMIMQTSPKGLYAGGMFVRGKKTKTKGSLSPMTQRVVTQLSVMSAGRKQPKMLKLSKEDLVKHQLIQKSWAIYNADLRAKRDADLEKQYCSLRDAMATLQEISPELYKIANADESDRKFPLEMKVPTDYPPNKVWQYEFRSGKN